MKTDNHAIDPIDRQAAINAIENTDCELSSEAWDEITDAIMSLPTAERRGKWIKRELPLPLSDGIKICYECSECLTHWDVPTNYCPYCGAKMEEIND